MITVCILVASYYPCVMILGHDECRVHVYVHVPTYMYRFKLSTINIGQRNFLLEEIPPSGCIISLGFNNTAAIHLFIIFCYIVMYKC